MRSTKKKDIKKDTPLSNFGKWLKSERNAKGLTQEDARKLAKPEISLNTWSTLERGNAKPRKETLLRAARALEVDEKVVQRVVDLALADEVGEDHAPTGGTAIRSTGTLAEEVERAQSAGNYSRAEILLRQAIAAEPKRENYYRELMLMLHNRGRKQDAIQVYNDLLNVVTMPSIETRQRFRRIQFDGEDASGRLVGRGTIRKQIREMFAVARLVTLYGREGVGKTALARSVADGLKGEFRDGDCFVSLENFSETRQQLGVMSGEEQVALAILFALKAPLSAPARSMSSPTYYSESLIAALETSAKLIVLDGCDEGRREDCAVLVRRLLRRCDYVCILATCRNEEGLGLEDVGEKLSQVPRLDIPSKDKSAAEMIDSSAALLFERLAGQIQDGFTITEQNKKLVTSICNQTQGLTTYIGWAASLLKFKTLEEIAKLPPPDLKEWQEWLLTSSLSSTERQLISSLAEAERLLLERLTIFPDGWTHEAVQEVCADEDVPRGLIPALLEMLEWQGLIYRGEQDGLGRGWVWEMLCEDIRNKMKPESRAGLMQKLLDWCLIVAEKAGDIYHQIAGIEQRYNQLEEEMDNIRASLVWALTSSPGDAFKGLRLTGLIWGFCNVRGYWTEGRYWLNEALTKANSYPASKAKLDALNGAGVLAIRQRDYERSEKWLTEALDCEYPGRTFALKADVLNSLGYLYVSWGKLDQAHEFYEKARNLYKGINQDDDAKRGAKWPFNGLGHIEMLRYRLDRSTNRLQKAKELYQESQNISKHFSDKDGVAQAERQLAVIAREQGKTDEAEHYLKQSLMALNELENRADTINVIEEIAELVGRKGTARALEKAVRLYAGAQHLRRIYGVFNESEEEYRERLDKVRKNFGARIGETEYAKQWQEGLQKSSQEVVFMALSDSTD